MPDAPILGRPFQAATMRTPAVVDGLLAEPTAGYALNDRGWFERGWGADYERLDAGELRERLGISPLEWDAWVRWKTGPAPKRGTSTSKKGLRL